MRHPNPFQVLGVTPQAERAVIRAAYRALAKMYHPDTQRGMTPEEASRRMSELNWAWEELRRDLAGWRVRVLAGQGAAPSQDSASAPAMHRFERPPRPQDKPFDEEGWRQFTEQYRRPRGDLRGWRAWIGSDVVCRECGCALKKEVYRCPDCGQTETWEMSKLYALGHRLSPVFSALTVGVGFLIVAPMAVGLLAIPPILVLDTVGVMKDDSGWPWEWGIDAQLLTSIGIAVEVGLIVAWNRLISPRLSTRTR